MSVYRTSHLNSHVDISGDTREKCDVFNVKILSHQWIISRKITYYIHDKSR